MTVRQVFYQMVSRQFINKSESEYKSTVVRLLGEMRRSGEIPYSWIADSTRWMRKPDTYDSMEHALLVTANCYRRSLWQNAETYVEVWLEKDALAGVLVSVTDVWDVPLLVTRGYPSITYIHAAGETVREKGKPTHIYYFGDHDPSGVDIPRFVEKEIRLAAPEIDLTFHRVAVTPEQIEDWQLPTRPTKQSDSRSKNFTGESVEVDALPPSELRRLVGACIEQHLDEGELEQTELVEQRERETLKKVAKKLSARSNPIDDYSTYN